MSWERGGKKQTKNSHGTVRLRFLYLLPFSGAARDVGQGASSLWLVVVVSPSRLFSFPPSRWDGDWLLRMTHTRLIENQPSHSREALTLVCLPELMRSREKPKTSPHVRCEKVVR